MAGVRHIRGDNFSAIRAVLYQALVNNFLQHNVVGMLQHSYKVMFTLFNISVISRLFHHL